MEFSYLPHLDSYTNLIRMYEKYRELDRKKLSPEQRHTRNLLMDLLILLNYVDWHHPYAFSLERMYTRCLDNYPLTEEMTIEQLRALQAMPMVVVADEGLRMHQEAVASKDWNHVEHTLWQFEHVQRECNTHALIGIRGRVEQLKKYKPAGQQGGRKPLDRNAICHDYDAQRLEGKERPLIITGLAQKYKTSKKVIQRILRTENRGIQEEK